MFSRAKGVGDECTRSTLYTDADTEEDKKHRKRKRERRQRVGGELSRVVGIYHVEHRIEEKPEACRYCDLPDKPGNWILCNIHDVYDLQLRK